MTVATAANAAVHPTTAATNGSEDNSEAVGGRFSRRRTFTRFAVLAIATTCFTLVSSNVAILNFTFVCMDKDPAQILLANGSTRSRFAFSQTERSILLWSASSGTILGLIPAGWLMVKLGARIVFLIAGAVSVLSTAILPLVAYGPFWWMCAARVFQGLAYGFDFAAIGMVCTRWAPLSELGIFVASLTTFSTLSIVITNPLAAFICNADSWRSVYYVHAALAGIAFVLWFLVYRDDAAEHRCVGARELAHINKGKTPAHIAKPSFVPYWEICKNPIILTVWLNSLSEMMSVIFILTYTPLFFTKVLSFDIATTGGLSALSAAIPIPFRLLSGVLSDRVQCVSEVNKMRISNTVALGLVGVYYALLGVATEQWQGVTLFCLIQICMACNSGGFYKCGSFVSRQHNHFVLANIQIMKCVAMFTSPLLMLIFVHDDSSHSQWVGVFVVHAVLLIATNALFCWVCTNKPAAFTLIEPPTSDREKSHSRQQDLSTTTTV